jgi:hypothetical protein
LKKIRGRREEGKISHLNGRGWGDGDGGCVVTFLMEVHLLFLLFKLITWVYNLSENIHYMEIY